MSVFCEQFAPGEKSSDWHDRAKQNYGQFSQRPSPLLLGDEREGNVRYE